MSRESPDRLRARKRAAQLPAPGSAAYADPEAWTDEDEQLLEDFEQGLAEYLADCRADDF